MVFHNLPQCFIIRILGKEYIVSNNWYEDDDKGHKKTEFTKFIADLLIQKGINAIVSSGLRYETSLDLSEFDDSLQKRNRVVFGAPGTGKSCKLNKDLDLLCRKFEPRL
jgi:hypothetical protein